MLGFLSLTFPCQFTWQEREIGELRKLPFASCGTRLREEATPGQAEGTPPETTSPTLTPDQALEVLRVTFKNYGQRFKGNPVGNNAEITAALNGKNPGQVRYLGEAPKLNDKGELLDGWGTPYFFHQLGGYDMEIHSAGPDRKMWTADDLVTR